MWDPQSPVLRVSLPSHFQDNIFPGSQTIIQGNSGQRRLQLTLSNLLLKAGSEMRRTHGQWEVRWDELSLYAQFLWKDDERGQRKRFLIIWYEGRPFTSQAGWHPTCHPQPWAKQWCQAGRIPLNPWKSHWFRNDPKLWRRALVSPVLGILNPALLIIFREWNQKMECWEQNDRSRAKLKNRAGAENNTG